MRPPLNELDWIIQLARKQKTIHLQHCIIRISSHFHHWNFWSPPKKRTKNNTVSELKHWKVLGLCKKIIPTSLVSFLFPLRFRCVLFRKVGGCSTYLGFSGDPAPPLRDPRTLDVQPCGSHFRYHSSAPLKPSRGNHRQLAPWHQVNHRQLALHFLAQRIMISMSWPCNHDIMYGRWFNSRPWKITWSPITHQTVEFRSCFQKKTPTELPGTAILATFDHRACACALNESSNMARHTNKQIARTLSFR